MTKLGAFWIPDVDAEPGRNLERSRLGFERHQGVQIAHLERALQWVPGRIVAVDGGANVGAWTRRMAERFSLVHAFEPNPAVFACLERNIKEWGIRDRVVCHAEGLSNRAGQASMRIAKGARTVTGRLGRGTGVVCVTLDSLYLEQCSFLKLDIEGHEARALAGASETLERCRPWVLIENKRRASGPVPAERILQDYGYELVEKIGDREIDWLYRPH